MNARTILATTLALALLVPVTAHATDGSPNCDDVAAEEDLALGDLYVEGTSVWQEDNGLEGLQTSQVTCHDQDAGGALKTFDADVQLV